MNFSAEELRRLWLDLAQARQATYPGDMHSLAAMHADIHLSHFSSPTASDIHPTSAIVTQAADLETAIATVEGAARAACERHGLPRDTPSGVIEALSSALAASLRR